jgi:hypothetical protein
MPEKKPRRKPKPKPKPVLPPQLGFLAVELLPDGQVRCVTWWGDALAADEDLRLQFLCLAEQMARGRLNRLFANAAAEIGLKLGWPDLGADLFDLFDRASPGRPAVRATQVFAPDNPRRGPIGVPDA